MKKIDVMKKGDEWIGKSGSEVVATSTVIRSTPPTSRDVKRIATQSFRTSGEDYLGVVSAL